MSGYLRQRQKVTGSTAAAWLKSSRAVAKWPGSKVGSACLKSVLTWSSELPTMALVVVATT